MSKEKIIQTMAAILIKGGKPHMEAMYTAVKNYPAAEAAAAVSPAALATFTQTLL